jgi:hypothetical protein
VRAQTGWSEIATRINDESFYKQTPIHKAIHPELREVNRKPNRALFLQFAFPNPECKVGVQTPCHVCDAAHFAQMYEANRTHIVVW